MKSDLCSRMKKALLVCCYYLSQTSLDKSFFSAHRAHSRAHSTGATYGNNKDMALVHIGGPGRRLFSPLRHPYSLKTYITGCSQACEQALSSRWEVLPGVTPSTEQELIVGEKIACKQALPLKMALGRNEGASNQSYIFRPRAISTEEPVCRLVNKRKPMFPLGQSEN